MGVPDTTVIGRDSDGELSLSLFSPAILHDAAGGGGQGVHDVVCSGNLHCSQLAALHEHVVPYYWRSRAMRHCKVLWNWHPSGRWMRC